MTQLVDEMARYLRKIEAVTARKPSPRNLEEAWTDLAYAHETAALALRLTSYDPPLRFASDDPVMSELVDTGLSNLPPVTSESRWDGRMEIARHYCDARSKRFEAEAE